MAKTKFKVTDPNGNIHSVSVLSKWLKENNLKEHGFRKVLRGLQDKCYGGYTIEKVDAEDCNKTSTMINLAMANKSKVTLIDIIRRENCHKIKFTSNKGETLTRKLNFSKVRNLNGVRCSLTNKNILLGEQVGTCIDNYREVYNFSLAELKKLGYSFDIDFSSPKIVEKIVKVVEEKFSPEPLENKLHKQMEDVVKEIKKTQDRLTRLKNAKDEIGRNLSSIIKASESVGKIDKLLGE